MYMKLKDGKSKVLTLSYDDGVVQDIRLMEILDKYGIKATFNINTGMYIPEDTVRQRFHGRMKLSEAKKLYTGSGHEVAVHGLHHPFLNKLKSDEILTQILEDRRNIENQYGTIARGMAYPYGKNCIIITRRIQPVIHLRFKHDQNLIINTPSLFHCLSICSIRILVGNRKNDIKFTGFRCILALCTSCQKSRCCNCS